MWMHEAQFIHDTKEQAVVQSSSLLHIMKEKPIVLLMFLADLKDTLDRCCVCKVEAVWVWHIDDDAAEKWEAHTPN